MVFQLVHLMLQHLAYLTVQCWVFLILQKLEKNFAVSKVHHLVYFSEMLKAYLKIPGLALMRAVRNVVHLAHKNDILKESILELCLD